MEWQREDAKLSEHERDQAVDDLIQLAVAIDGILQMQSKADTDYFTEICPRDFSEAENQAIYDGVLKAYRWQYIFSGVKLERFQKVLTGMIDDTQMSRIQSALGTLL